MVLLETYFLFYTLVLPRRCCLAHVAYGDGNDGGGEVVGDDTTLFFLLDDLLKRN